MHFYSPQYQDQETRYRIYLNPKCDYFPDVVKALIDLGKELPLYFKIVDPVGPNDFLRTDKIIIYLTDENIDLLIEFITNFAKSNPEFFKGRSVAGSSSVPLGDGIGLAKETNHRTGGQINAERIEKLLVSHIVNLIGEEIDGLIDEGGFLNSEMANFIRLTMNAPKWWKFTKELSDKGAEGFEICSIFDDDKIRDIWVESFLKAIYHIKARIAQDELGSYELFPEQSVLKEFFINELRIKGYNNIASQIEQMDLSSFKKAFYYINKLSDQNLRFIGLGMIFYNLISSGKGPEDF